jgi:hypothetical protein
VPTVTVVTDVFLELGREVANALGAQSIRTSVVAHPLGELKDAEVRERSRKAFPDIMRNLLAPAVKPGKDADIGVPQMPPPAASADEIDDFFYAQGFTDGLPIVPPRRYSVDKMLASVRHGADTVIGVIPPRMGLATVEKIAINAVMAGCRPEYFPVVLASVKAICMPEFNLLPMQATTNPVTPMLVVGGPVVRELQINSGYNVLGQGRRSNATIGRALRFVLTNIGGGIPGKLDKACHGQPGKFSLCIAENIEASPWPPFHVDKGYSARDSTVSVIGVTGTQDIIHYARTSAREVLNTIVHSIPREGYKNLYSGGEPLLILGPEQAAILGKEGYSKQHVRQIVFDGTQIPVTLFNADTVQLMRSRRPRLFAQAGEPAAIPIADCAEDIQIIVAGAAGNHSVFLPTWGDTRCVTVAI